MNYILFTISLNSKMRFLCLVLLMQTFSLFGLHAHRVDFRDGYIVRINNDTIHGLIYYSDAYTNSRKCIFKETYKSDVIEYSPKDLISYAFKGNITYISKKIPTNDSTKSFFVEYLADGVLKLYYLFDDFNQDKYFVERRGKLFLLTKDGSSPSHYQKVLKYLMSNVPSIKEDIEFAEFSRISIMRVLKLYHGEVSKGTKFVSYYDNTLKDLAFYLGYKGNANKKIMEDDINRHNFKRGYIVTLKNDTIIGFIDDRNSFSNSRFCLFKESQTEDYIKYTPDELKGYTFFDSKHYISKAIPYGFNTVVFFLEYLVDGVIDLYFFVPLVTKGDDYFIEKDGKLYGLSDDEIEYYDNGKKHLANSFKYRSQLKYLMKEAKSLKEEIDKSELEHGYLVDLTKRYHKIVCETEECIDYYVKPND